MGSDLPKICRNGKQFRSGTHATRTANDSGATSSRSRGVPLAEALRGPELVLTTEQGCHGLTGPVAHRSVPTFLPGRPCWLRWWEHGLARAKCGDRPKTSTRTDRGTP